MRRRLIIVGTLLIAIVLALGACGPAPPEFEVISLNVQPAEAVAGETVSITAVVKNIGGSEGTYAVILTIDRVTIETKEVTLTPGSSKVVAFSLVKDAPGTYEIGIGELSSSLTITPSPPEFEVISLDIEPAETVAGETVSITAEVKNIGGTEGTYAAILTVDRVTVETKEVAIAPDSSEMVTFSLVKDEPGTYEIGIEKLSSSLTVKEKLVVKKVELKYDDGTSDGAYAIGRDPGRGHAVHFSPPATPFTINEVKIYGSLYGTGYEKLLAHIEVSDEDFNILYSGLEPHTKFSSEPSWLSVSIPDIVVDGDFYILVGTTSPREGGINIHYDSSVVNKHSEVTEAHHIADWYLGIPKEVVNWMIRVVGTAMLPPD